MTTKPNKNKADKQKQKKNSEVDYPMKQPQLTTADSNQSSPSRLSENSDPELQEQNRLVITHGTTSIIRHCAHYSYEISVTNDVPHAQHRCYQVPNLLFTKRRATRQPKTYLSKLLPKMPCQNYLNKAPTCRTSFTNAYSHKRQQCFTTLLLFLSISSSPHLPKL